MKPPAQAPGNHRATKAARSHAAGRRQSIVGGVSKRASPEPFSGSMTPEEMRQIVANLKLEPGSSTSSPVSKPIASATIYFVGTVIGLVVGTILCLGGLAIVIMGFTGSITWLVQGAGLSSKLYNASPGVMFAAFGLVVLWRFKPRIEERKKSSSTGTDLSTIYLMDTTQKNPLREELDRLQV